MYPCVSTVWCHGQTDGAVFTDTLTLLQVQDLKRRCAEKDQSLRPLEEQVQRLQEERESIQQELEEANRDRYSCQMHHVRRQLSKPTWALRRCSLCRRKCCALARTRGHSARAERKARTVRVFLSCRLSEEPRTVGVCSRHKWARSQ